MAEVVSDNALQISKLTVFRAKIALNQDEGLPQLRLWFGVTRSLATVRAVA